MLKELFDFISVNIKTSVSSLERFESYGGEFEENADWNPVFPCAYYELEKYKPVLKDSSGTGLDFEANANIYVADKHSAIGIMESVLAYFNGLSIDLRDDDEVFIAHFNIQVEEVKLIGWRKVVEIYQILIKIN